MAERLGSRAQRDIEIDQSQPLNCHVRRPLAAAIAWQLLAELARRYDGVETLHVLEMHPAGGQYDQLTIWSTPDHDGDVYAGQSRQLLTLDISGSAHGDESDRRFHWLARWLSAGDVKEVVEELAHHIGLPLRAVSASTDKYIFGMRLIASLLKMHALERFPLNACMGFCDSSGIAGSGVLPIVKDLVGPELSRETDASRWWLLERWPSKTFAALVNTDGRIVSATAPSPGIDLFQHYSKTRDIEEVARAAIDLL
jgi:hypothetical protein